MHECKCTTRDFSGQEGKKGGGGRWIVVVGHFDNISTKAQVKETPHGNILKFFLLDTPKTTF